MKRTLSLLLVLMMLLSTLPLNAFAAETAQAEQTTEAAKTAESTELAEATEEAVVSEPEAEHTHEYAAGLSAPTCTEQGYTTYTCACGDSFVDDYVDATGHSYANGSCTLCGSASTPYLQQLPENITGCINLYDLLTPSKGYYTATKYDTSNGAVLSVVIPVEPGDRIAASSFGPVSENMGSVNGIRVTYLLGDEIVSSLSAGDVYNGYTTNGYITVPDGVDAVCIPWWTPSDSNWLTLGQISKNFAAHSPKAVPAQAPTCMETGYTAGEICEVCGASLGTREEIPATGHAYNGNTCTTCGTVNVLAILDGKYVSVLGDSISTFNGYSNDAAVNTTIGGNGPRYDAGTADTKPGSYCLLESVDDTWWMHFANRSGMKLLVNNSWAGSQVFGGQTSDGRQIPPAYLARCINLHDNTTDNNPGNAPINPDVIFVYLGINDYNFNRNNVGSGAVDYAKLLSSDGSYVTPTTFGEAYGILLHKMQNAYPNAQIFAMTLLPENLYSVDMAAWEQHNAYIRAAAEYYDIPLVDLAEKCAITWENYSGYMMDKIHPTTAGMKLISDCIEAELVAYYTANPPHTHAYETSTTAPTCTEKGYTTYTCVCGDSYVADYVDATGHSYANGSCTICGTESPSAALWRGKSAVFVGDSITAGTGTTRIYYQYLEEMIGFGSVTAMGVPGSCVSAASDYGQSTQPLIKRYQQIPSADLIVIFMGTNDYGHETPLGSVEDTQDGTFYGALNTIIPALVAKHSSSKIVFVTSLHRYGYGTSKILGTKFTYDNIPNGVGSTLGDYVNALKTVCANNGVTVIDLHTECTLDPTDAAVRSIYIPDGLHPNAAGHALIAGIMESHIRNYEPVEKAPEVETEPEEKTELIYGNKFTSGFDQKNRASARVNQYLKAGTVITLKDPETFQWGCAKTTGENSSTNLGYFPDPQWTDKETAVVEADGWVGFVFKYRDETKVFDLTKPLSDYITIHTHAYETSTTAPTCTEQGYTTYTCACGDSYVADYADATGHSYANGTCTGCGAEHPNLANYEGKVISILGGSNCTFAGYIPVADGFNLEHRSRYPDTSRIPDVTDVSQTWWMQLLTQMDAKLGINDSWAGSQVLNTLDSNSGDLGPDAAMASLTRIQNLGANGTPDVILFFGGCNDIGRDVTLGSFDPATAPTQADLTATKWDSFADAYVAAITRMQHFYPNAKILVMLPYNSPTYFTASKVEKYGAVIRAICDHYGVDYVDLRDSGINSNHLPDNIHPNAEGSDYITTAVLDALLSSVELEAGEQIVHSVTHELTGAKSSLSYYKGVSDGKSFVTTITGEDVMVAVTMGGVDITDQVYALGKVMISAVTGDVVITAKGAYNADGRLQQLPNDYCCNTNLWTALDPVNEYYTTSGWGNNSNSNYSVTFPVTVGDRIWATSFGAAGTNGYTANAVRITWFGEDGVLKSLVRDVVYAEFAEYGYITVPEGAVAVNIPMASNADTWEIYILNRGHSYENGSCTGCGVAAWDTDGDGVLEILAIGNSFSVDALEYAYQIAQDLGIGEIVLGNLYIGGCTLATHAANAAGDLGKYTYYYNDNGTWTSTGSYKISTALESRSWDYVSMQQGSPVSGVESSYNDDLTDLIAYVQERSDAKLVWHMTWAYQQNSTHSAFPTYNKDQMTMYNAIVSAVQNKIVTNSAFDLIVPNGTAVQNSRTSLLGDTTTRDGYHMSKDYGRYMTGLLFIKTVTGLSVDGVTYVPSGVDAEEKAIAIESVNNAAAKPFAVTKSAYVKVEPEIPDEGYILLQPELHKGAYWNATDKTQYNVLIADATNSKYYFATPRFTKKELPVGSIIVLESGWQYRPDGWVTDAVQSSRADTTTESYVVVTEEWWGNYTLRGFNISKVGTPSIMDLSAEDIHKVFRIYVPEEKHFHDYISAVTAPTCTEKGYTAYTCTLCGDTYVDDYVDATGKHTYANGVCTGCGETIKVMSMRYDDHKDMSGKVVEIIDAGTPTSYQVGYGVEENKVLDTAVVTLEGDTLVATGIGTATVKVDGETYEITVTAAPISLLLIIGQSNAEGMVGRDHQSIANENGQVYSTYAEANGLTGDAGLTADNAGNYVPSALTGAYSEINVNGTDSKLSNYPVNSLTEEGTGKYGMDSGIAYEWVQQTGEKVWVVNAAHGASSISSWQPGESNFEEAVALMDACQDVLRKEIAAGHFTFSHMGYYWCQGCADETKSAQWYVEQYVSMHEALKVDMAFDADLNPATTDITMEFGGIILVMAGHENATGYRKGVYTDSSDSFFASFKELEMRGPRVAQIWMANNPELSDIHLVCTLAQDWVTMPDGNDGVAEYFASHYQNGVIDYPTQVEQSTSWYSPTAPANVKNTIHYYQVGYNEVGRESARNTLYILGMLEKPNVETTVSFVDWTGYQTVDSIKSSGVGSSETLVVPLVSPCYDSKTVTYSLSNGLSWNYYDLLDTGVDGGTLTASIDTQTVSVIGREYYSYRFELVDGEMVSVNNDTFRENLLTATTANTYTLADTILLKHDKEWIVEFNSIAADRFMALASSKGATEGMFYFFKSKSGSGVLSIGEYKDGLYQNYGLKQSQIDVDWTQPHVCRFQNVINDDGTNTIHIYVDGEWVGTATNLIINDVLQSTDNMYLSGKDFAFVSIGCNGFGLANNQMSYLEIWENHNSHTYQNGSCTACGASQPGPVITQQPTNGEAKLGERYMVEVKAEGEGLKYQWYLRNAGASQWYKSSVKDSTYDDVMTTARAGREVYCVITDANGNSVTTDTAKLICLPAEELAITKQPTNGEAVLGERYCVTVEAKGEKLKYQWYFRNKGATSWSKSGVTDNTYDDVMNTTRDGREVYCVITDIAGNKVTTDIVKLVRIPMKLEIISQPTDAKAAFDEMFCATVEARGEGLKYQWYYRNAGANTWHKSGVRDNTYDDIMNKARANREVYCVITDQWGNSVTTDIVKLIAVPRVELKILSQTYESAAMGERYCVTVNAQGDGLTYQWYFRNAGATRWSKSGVRDNTYDDVMNKTRANREVYCVITDAIGNQVTTDVVTLTVKN